MQCCSASKDLGQRLSRISSPNVGPSTDGVRPKGPVVVSTGRFTAGVIARSHGRLSARVLGDSPISASLPPTFLPVLQATRI